MAPKTLFNAIDSFVQQHNLIPEGSTIILGFSGGPDSVLLLVYLVHLRDTGHIKKLIAAHLDHEWRTDSHQDVQFCQKFAARYKVEFISQKISSLAISGKFDGSQEAYGRAARRQFLEQIRTRYDADFIALAHHLQDQEETFFIRLMRGSSLTGLTCMWPRSGDYIRPLLELQKSDIIAYLIEHDLPFLTDPSNESPAFLRNRIRATVLPALRACDTRFDQNFLMTLNRLQETEQFLEILTAEALQHITTEANSLMLPAFFNVHKALQYRVLLKWLITHDLPFTPSQTFLEEIMRFMRTPGSNQHAIHKAWKLVKVKDILSIEKTC